MLAGAQFRHYRRQVVFRNGEHDRDRLQLGDHDQAVRVAGAHDVAEVDLAQPEAAADRRGDAAVDQLQLGGVDRRLVDLDGGLVLAHQGFLRIDLLFGDRILLEQRAIAFHVDLRVLQQRLVARHLAFGRGELRLEGAWIDFREKIARAHDLAFREKHPHELPVDAAFYGHCRNRRHRTQAREIHAHIGGFDGGCNDRHRPVAALAALALAFAFGICRGSCVGL